MRITLYAILLAGLLIVAGCGTVHEEPAAEQQTIPTIEQAVLTDPVQPAKGTETVKETLRIRDNQFDPEEIRLPADSTLELSIDSDKIFVLSLFGETDKIVNTSVVTLNYKVPGKGTYELSCVSGCDLPSTVNIVVE